jgi:hypothetical membrane protein
MGQKPGVTRLSAVHMHSLAVAASIVAAVVSALVALVVFRSGSVPFSGAGSVGVVAATIGGVLGSLGFVLAYTHSLSVLDASDAAAIDRSAGGAVDPFRFVRRVLDTVALLLTHLGIWVVISLGLFAILQRAIADAQLDAITASAFVAGAVAVAVYSMQASGSSISAFRVSTLLSVFGGSGMLVSIVTAPDPEWWRVNFSALGTFDGFSGLIFNFTLIVTGAVIVTLADYITADLREWVARQPRGASARVSLVGAGIAAIGLCLTGVGAFPADRMPMLHGVVAIAMVVFFGVLALGLPWLLPGFPRMFFVLGYASVGLIVLVTFLYIPVGFYNETALELVGAAMVLGWIIILIRMVGALEIDAAEPSATPRAALR